MKRIKVGEGRQKGFIAGDKRSHAVDKPRGGTNGEIENLWGATSRTPSACGFWADLRAMVVWVRALLI